MSYLCHMCSIFGLWDWRCQRRYLRRHPRLIPFDNTIDARRVYIPGSSVWCNVRTLRTSSETRTNDVSLQPLEARLVVVRQPTIWGTWGTFKYSPRAGGCAVTAAKPWTIQSDAVWYEAYLEGGQPSLPPLLSSNSLE